MNLLLLNKLLAYKFKSLNRKKFRVESTSQLTVESAIRRMEKEILLLFKQIELIIKRKTLVSRQRKVKKNFRKIKEVLEQF